MYNRKITVIFAFMFKIVYPESLIFLMKVNEGIFAFYISFRFPWTLQDGFGIVSILGCSFELNPHLKRYILMHRQAFFNRFFFHL